MYVCVCVCVCMHVRMCVHACVRACVRVDGWMDGWMYLHPLPPRPQFVLDVDTKEEYFIELILSRHARKLLTASCLRDLGKFSTHLDFSLEKWLSRERC